jgi:hypothetical protein
MRKWSRCQSVSLSFHQILRHPRNQHKNSFRWQVVCSSSKTWGDNLLSSFPLVRLKVWMMIFIWFWKWKVSFYHSFTAWKPIMVTIECKSTWRQPMTNIFYHFWRLASTNKQTRNHRHCQSLGSPSQTQIFLSGFAMTHCSLLRSLGYHRWCSNVYALVGCQL